MFTLTDRIDFRVDSRHDLYDRLETAVRNLQEAAMQEMKGEILITSHKPGHYTAELSDRVPFGMTLELHRRLRCSPREGWTTRKK